MVDLQHADPSSVTVNGVTFNRRTGEFSCGDRMAVITSTKEQTLLFLLMHNANEEISRTRIQGELYPGGIVSTGSIKVFVSRLRLPLRTVTGDILTIASVRDGGYILRSKTK